MEQQSAIVMRTGIHTHWQNNEFVDFTIHIQDRQFQVHKVIVSSMSEYLRGLMQSGMVESQREMLHLKGLSAAVAEVLLRFIYTGHLDLTQDNVEDMLAGAVYLQIPTAIKVCTDFMFSYLDNENCVPFLLLLKNYGLLAAVKDVSLYIRKNMQSITKCGIEKKPYDQVCVIMDGWTGSEWELFESVLKWVRVDEQRHQHLDALMSRIRFCLLNPTDLRSIQMMPVYMESEGKWRTLIKKARDYHRLATHVKVAEDTEQSTVRTEPTAVCFPWDLDSGCRCFFSLDENNKWIENRDCRLRTRSTGDDNIAAAVVANNFLIVHLWFVDDETNESHIFDPRSQSWSQLAPLPIYRFCYKLLHNKNHLYVVGGYGPHEQKDFEMIYTYEFETNTWFPFTKLPCAHTHPAACIFGDSIYVCGGYSQKDHMGCHVDCIGLTTKKCERKAPLLEDMSGYNMGVMKLFGEDTLFVMNRHCHFEYYNVVSDQWYKCPISISSKIPAKISSYVQIHLGNTFFLLNRINWNEEFSMKLTFTEDGQDVVIEDVENLPDHGVRACYNFGVSLAVPQLPAKVD